MNLGFADRYGGHVADRRQDIAVQNTDSLRRPALAALLVRVSLQKFVDDRLDRANGRERAARSAFLSLAGRRHLRPRGDLQRPRRASERDKAG